MTKTHTMTLNSTYVSEGRVFVYEVGNIAIFVGSINTKGQPGYLGWLATLDTNMKVAAATDSNNYSLARNDAGRLVIASNYSTTRTGWLPINIVTVITEKSN